MSRMRGDTGVGTGEVLRSAYLKKLKTARRKFFVVKNETPESSARLEYWDSEKKYNSGAPPKRSIVLKSCFNINKRNDTKYKHVVALYTKDDCFCVVFENEEDADSWLKIMLSLQQGREDVIDGAAPKPTFASRPVLDEIRCELNIPYGDRDREKIDVYGVDLDDEHVWDVNILNKGLGKEGLTGSYRLCLTDNTLNLIKVGDDENNKRNNIQLNLSNIRSCGNLKDFFLLELGRSSCLGAGRLWMETEDTNIGQNMHSTIFHAMASNKDDMGPKGRIRSSSATESSKPTSVPTRKHSVLAPKNYILSQDSQTDDSQVPSSSTQHPIVSGVASFYHHLIHRGTSKASERRHSISAGGVGSSGLISHQRTQSLPLANPALISDQNTNTSHPLRAPAKRSNQSSKCVGGGGRERCDSMPTTRGRTTSESSHLVQMWNPTRCHLLPYRPASLYNHSPPSGSPVSPPSAPCSTDSAGSSYSLADDRDEHEQTIGGYSHSLTPDEAIAEEECCPDSPPPDTNYMLMNVPSSDDGYVDMSPKGRHLHHSPTASMSSVTSGTPSTDWRFAEYPLEKVVSHLSEEGDEDRPTRAYSVGSRQDCCNRNESLRVRALSVGSKAKKIPSRILPPHSHHHPMIHGSGGGNNKSSSAPILSNSSSRTHQGSYNSIGPMDDLMEMDFSSSNSRSNSVYMDMKPKVNALGYVEMKPGGCGALENRRSRDDVSPYVDMTSGSSPAKFPSSFINDCAGDYMEMDGKRRNTNSSSSSSIINNNNYMDMSSNKKSLNNEIDTNNYQLSPAKTSFLIGSPSGYYHDTRNQATTPDGYVEMSIGKGHHKRQSSLDSAQIVSSSSSINEDYANMSVGGANGSNTNNRKRERNSKKKDKVASRSQPIAIQNPQQKVVPPPQITNSSSPKFSLLGRKFSTGTPPSMMHLPLNDSTPYSSLPRQRSRKNSRRDSKDSSSSSVTTPSSSSTIFPLSLNSPCSPVKPENPVTNTNIKVPPAVLNTVYKKSQNKNKQTINKTDNDYIPMDFEHSSQQQSSKKTTSDYVNYDPATTTATTTTTSQLRIITSSANSLSKHDDYALMRPPIKNNLAPSSPSTSFRPINENKDEDKPETPDPAYELLRTRPSSTSSELCSSSGSTIVGSRPESVNSDRVRPPSVSSADVQLHYASLDLEDGNRSPRTIKNNQSDGVPEPALSYAAIDFIKSEGLKHNFNAKVKH